MPGTPVGSGRPSPAALSSRVASLCQAARRWRPGDRPSRRPRRHGRSAHGERLSLQAAGPHPPRGGRRSRLAGSAVTDAREVRPRGAASGRVRGACPRSGALHERRSGARGAGCGGAGRRIHGRPRDDRGGHGGDGEDDDHSAHRAPRSFVGLDSARSLSPRPWPLLNRCCELPVTSAAAPRERVRLRRPRSQAILRVVTAGPQRIGIRLTPAGAAPVRRRPSPVLSKRGNE